MLTKWTIWGMIAFFLAACSQSLGQMPTTGSAQVGALRASISVSKPDGTKYVGEIRNGKPDGRGTLTGPKGFKYVGEFRDGQPYGRANVDFMTEDGKRYTGEVFNAKPDGRGTLSDPSSGFRLEGTFSNGELNGPFVAETKDGVFSGEASNGAMNGASDVKLKNGTRFQGILVNNVPHGSGVVTDASGARFVGEFRNGVADGFGTLFAPDGTIVRRGVWADDRLVRSDSVRTGAESVATGKVSRKHPVATPSGAQPMPSSGTTSAPAEIFQPSRFKQFETLFK